MKNKIIFAAITLGFVRLYAFSLDQVRLYDQRYLLQNTQQKLVDNTGEGFAELYGVRNFRAVLRGIVYRGGANNAYNKYGKRDNQNPLPDMGLKNLCEEGFSTAVYLYTTRFSTAPSSVSCQNFLKEKNTLQYKQITAMDEKNVTTFLELIYKAIKGQIASPIYLHCWNGWHASGLVSTLALRQFCGLSADEGLRYWTANTDGHSQGYDTIKNRIRDFKPLPQFQISADEQRALCF